MVKKAMISQDGPPDALTPLLPSQGTTPDEQIIGVPAEETATSNDYLDSESSQVAVHTESDPNPDKRSWTGLPRWLGWIAILALFLGCETTMTETALGSCTDTQCSISTVNIETSFMLTAYLKIGKTSVCDTDNLENTHNHQAQNWATNKMQHGLY
jgi:hypothetical protein